MSSVAAWATRHAKAVLAVAVVLALAAGVAATQLATDAGTGTLVDSDSASYKATREVREVFGEEPVVVLAKGDLQGLILTANLGRLLRLEGCLAARAPKKAKPLPGPCAELARMEPVQFLVGPATFLNEAVIQIDRQLRLMATRMPPAQLRQFLLSVAARYGITSLPSLGNPDFLANIVFDLSRPRGTPKARLSYLFPNDHSAQIVLRLRPDLSEGERHRALELIDAAVHETTPRRECAFKGRPAPCFKLHRGEYVISGAPVVIDGVSRALKDALLVLLLIAVVVMALVLMLVFGSRLRLLPLLLALAAASLTFGLLALVGGSLTMASIAVLPILIGLAVDYAIQFQARYDEAVAAGADGAEAARLSAGRGGPAIGTACLATAAGFLALQLSPTPMVRGFGLLLIAGIAIAFLLALTGGFAALSLRPRGAAAPRRLAAASDAVRRLFTRALSFSLTHTGWVLGVALALALVGWVAGTRVSTVSDIRSLAPQSLPAVRDLNELQEVTGVSGQLDVQVQAPDLTDPATIRWMAAFKQRVLRANGFDGPNPSCQEAEVCPGPALSDFLVGEEGRLTRGGIRETLAQLSPYDLQQVAPINPRTGEVGHTALLSFGIRAQSLEDQQALVDRVRAEIGQPGSAQGPPEGVEVRLAGLPVIAAQSATDLSGSRYWLTLAGLAAVALVLLAVYRSLLRALVPLAPTVLATGWSSLILWVSGIPLNPMSAALGALTIAIATEFSVILTARFYEELPAAGSVPAALARAYRRTGAAVLASGATAIAGFGVLVASDIAMLRDFGLVTVIDLSVALLGVMLVLPAVLAWVEEQ
ncbi:MAG TPA: MMPL family transporter [Solirubrobacterales bacterium]|nr:MMPL family transporter [Solirubrobacterales bacterium]